MSERKYIVLLAGCVLSVSLIATSLTAYFLTAYYARVQTQAIGEICQGILEQQPEAKAAVLSALKAYSGKAESWQEDFLLAYGYSENNFMEQAGIRAGLPTAAGFLMGGALFLGTLLFGIKKNGSRIRQLTEYLEKLNSGDNVDLFQVGEDGFSRLQDEIYKTVTELWKTREEAVNAKHNFAENLYNIAHQIKTPITAISLSAQMMKKDFSQKETEQNEQMEQKKQILLKEQIDQKEFIVQKIQIKQAQQNEKNDQIEQIEQQISRLTYLEEALLLLSRIDAGTLPLDRREVDVFTVLTLAADNLQALFTKAEVSLEIPESGECVIHADLDWTMEAIMNLLKNCMEHTPPGGGVYCSYEQNLLYTQIKIWDTGSGFEKEDIPHLFERFYRGKNSKDGGIGIGLSLSRAIIESQNGTITARNLPEGGACFELHFYSH